MRAPRKLEGKAIWPHCAELRVGAALARQRRSARRGAERLLARGAAGFLSTAHTVLYYDRHGRDVFRRLAAIVFCVSTGVFMVAVGALLDASRATMEKLYFAGMAAGVAVWVARRFPIRIAKRSIDANAQ